MVVLWQSGDFWSGLLLGLIVGGTLGILVMAFALAAQEGGKHGKK